MKDALLLERYVYQSLLDLHQTAVTANDPQVYNNYGLLLFIFHPSFSPFVPSFLPHFYLPSFLSFFYSLTLSCFFWGSHWFISLLVYSITVTRLPWIQFPWRTGGQHQTTLRLCRYPEAYGKVQLLPRRISLWQNDPWRRRQESWSLSFSCFLVNCNERDWWMWLWTCYLLVLIFEFSSHLRGVVRFGCLVIILLKSLIC